MSFDCLAPHYRWMEFILAGEKLQRCRTAFLDEIPLARNILLLGEGPGRCLVECCRRFANAQITCVDASEQMLRQARHQLKPHKMGTYRVEFIHADALNWMPTGKSYDLIITNFFLDCFHAYQMEQLVLKLATVATPNATWLLADFQIPPTGLRRFRSQVIIWTMYVFFRAMTRLSAHKLTPPDSLLLRTGFTLVDRVESEWGLLHSDWWLRQKNDSAIDPGQSEREPLRQP